MKVIRIDLEPATLGPDGRASEATLRQSQPESPEPPLSPGGDA